MDSGIPQQLHNIPVDPRYPDVLPESTFINMTHGSSNAIKDRIKQQLLSTHSYSPTSSTGIELFILVATLLTIVLVLAMVVNKKSFSRLKRFFSSKSQEDSNV